MRIRRKLLSLLMVMGIILALLPATSVFAVGGALLEISNSVDKNEISGAGDTITYTYHISNIGDKLAEGPFMLTDSLGSQIDDSLFPTSLAPGQSFSVAVSYQINDNDLAQNPDHPLIPNQITLTTSEDPVPRTSDASIRLHLGPGLTIQKKADKNVVTSVGEVITYTYTVTHTGPDENIYGSVDGAAPGPFILEDDKIAHDIIKEDTVKLEPGQSFTVSAEYIVTQADLSKASISNKVTVQGFYNNYPDDPIEAQAELSIPIKKQSGSGDRDRENPRLKLEKSADKKEFSQVGEIITYTYLISNTGNTQVRGDFYGSFDASFKLTDDKINTIDMSKTPLELDPGKSFTVTAEYKVSQADLDAGKITNIATVTGVSGNHFLKDSDTLTIIFKEKEEVPVPDKPSIGDKLNTEDHFQYIAGYPDHTVRPDGLITREEVAAVFYRLLTPSYRDHIITNRHHFEDVKSGRWSEQSIATLTNGKIIVGYEDGSFRPGNSITRAELAAIASRFDHLEAFSSDMFSDIDNHWANKVINSASQKGWVNGYSDGSFRPNQYMTRAEFVALVNNVLNRGVKKENILPDAKQFPDLLESKWYYETMQEAINSHLYIRDLETNEEIWIEIY